MPWDSPRHTLYEAQIEPSEIRLNSKPELLDKNLLECRNVVLLIEQKHSFFVINAIHRPERDGAVTIGDKHGIACDAGHPFVAIVERLYIRKQDQHKECLFKHIVAAVHQVACLPKGLANLELVINRSVIGSRDAYTARPDVSVNTQFLDEQAVDVLNVRNGESLQIIGMGHYEVEGVLMVE